MARGPELFVKFAKLDGTTSGILDFANNYGSLGIRDLLVSQSGHEEFPGEGLDIWQRAISTMGFLLQAWEWIRQGNVGKLGLHITWAEDRSVGFTFTWVGGEIISGRLSGEREARATAEEKAVYSDRGIIADADGIYPEVFHRWKRGDLIGTSFNKGSE